MGALAAVYVPSMPWDIDLPVWTKFGFIYDPKEGALRSFVNGREIGRFLTHSADAVSLFPSGEIMQCITAVRS